MLYSFIHANTSKALMTLNIRILICSVKFIFKKAKETIHKYIWYVENNSLDRSIFHKDNFLFGKNHKLNTRLAVISYVSIKKSTLLTKNKKYFFTNQTLHNFFKNYTMDTLKTEQWLGWQINLQPQSPWGFRDRS